jgi:hypothetical protein
VDVPLGAESIEKQDVERGGIEVQGAWPTELLYVENRGSDTAN